MIISAPVARLLDLLLTRLLLRVRWTSLICRGRLPEVGGDDIPQLACARDRFPGLGQEQQQALLIHVLRLRQS